MAELLNLLGEVAQRRGELAPSAGLLAESLALHRDVGDKGSIAVVLHNLGKTAQLQGQPARATSLFVAAEALHQTITGATRATLTDPADREHDVAAARASPGEEAFAAAWAEGQAMRLEESIAHASKQEPVR